VGVERLRQRGGEVDAELGQVARVRALGLLLEDDDSGTLLPREVESLEGGVLAVRLLERFAVAGAGDRRRILRRVRDDAGQERREESETGQAHASLSVVAPRPAKALPPAHGADPRAAGVGGGRPRV
jgi:hypothetical protein